jgi:hypothetical protein
MSKEIIFTRYLYEKAEVEISLFLSLLSKKEEEALFWGYELYYSGFQNDLIDQLWKIYYDFYASLNPGFYTYLSKKLKNLESKTLGSVIQNFIIRAFNLDVFILRQIQNHFELPKTEKNLKKVLLEEESPLDYEALVSILYQSTDKELLKQLDINNNEFVNCKKTWKKIEKRKTKVDKKIVLCALLLNIYGNKQKKQMGKNIYICSDPSNFVMYETIEVDLTPQENKKIPNLPAYKILPLACIYSISESKFLSTFQLKRETKTTKREAYLNNWLDYTWKSPVWLERIQSYGGTIQENNKVLFEDEEKEEDFYKHYGYEPDEQKKEVQERSIQEIQKTDQEINILSFYQEFSKKSFLELDNEYLKLTL